MVDKKQCSELVSGEGSWGAFHQHLCYKPATVKRDGKWYCKVHDPDYVKEKRRIVHEKWEMEVAKLHLQRLAPFLLGACKRAHEASYDPKVNFILKEAIDKAEKRSD